jgi:23S rRNA pseudouridine1911/1915/1917 synthase
MAEQQSDQSHPFYEEKQIVVDPGQSPIRLDKFLGDRLENVSRNKIQNALKAGAITVNKKPCKSNYKVRPQDRIDIVMPKFQDPEAQVQPEDIPLHIEYEDEDILIVNKEPGMVVHPGIGNYTGTLVNALTFYLQNSDMPVMEGNSPDRPGLVHRIDKDTSGLLVIAKNDFAMTHLAKQFFDHTIERKYVALVWGAPEPATGTIEANIGRHPRYRLQQTVFEEEDEGKNAITHYETIEDLYYVSVVKCQLETGRTHQIRVHMKHIGHPVFNDARYDGDRIRKGTVFTKYKQFVHNCFELIPRQALHAQTLGFIHPRSGEKVYFESALPDDMNSVLEKWRHYLTHRKKGM